MTPDKAAETKVLFIWDVPERLADYLNSGLDDLEDLILVYPDRHDEEEYLRLVEDADIIVGWRPSEELFEAAHRLQLHINPGAGVQHLLPRFREFYKENTVTLVNGHGNSYFTAQHAVALLLALTNKVVRHHNGMVSGLWRTANAEARSTPLRNRHIGLLGYGAVNSKTHRFLSGFDVEFSVLKRSWNKNEKLPTQVNKFVPTQLHEFLERIDTLIIAVPLTEETEGLIGEEELNLLGEDGFLVNMGRGGIVVQEALYRALSDGKIRSAAIDVWYDYNPKPDDEGRFFPYEYKFHELENVVLSPHRGASPMNDLKRWDEVIENIKRFHQGRFDLINVVDVERGY